MFPGGFNYWGAIIEGTAIIMNAGYVLRSFSIAWTYKSEAKNEFSSSYLPRYIDIILILLAITLFFWFDAWLSWVFGTKMFIGWLGYAAIWFFQATLTYVLAYFAIQQQELFKIMREETATNKASAILLNGELKPLLEKLEMHMVNARPYLEPKLSLRNLSESLDITPQRLSALINNGHQKNFFDFINAHRVEEFKRLVDDPQNSHKTLLGLAFEAGFNSKTTFNTAFKKITGTTPKTFLKNIQLSTEA